MITTDIKRMITTSQSPKLATTTIKPLSEEQYASLLAKGGLKIIEHRGAYLRHAREYGSLLLVPTHWMATLSPEQTIMPQLPCMILKARVSGSSESANGAFNLHRLCLKDGEDYWDMLTGKSGNTAKRKIKQASQVIFVEQIDQPEALRDKGEGYAVLSSALRRANYKKIPEKADYETKLEVGTFLSGEMLVLGGYQECNTKNKRLVGYLTGHTVGKTAYIAQMLVSDEGLKTNVGTRLLYTFVEICQRSDIEEIIYGRGTPDDPNLEQYKETMKFPSENIPANVLVRPSIKPLVAFITHKKPHYKERLYGQITDTKLAFQVSGGPKLNPS